MPSSWLDTKAKRRGEERREEERRGAHHIGSASKARRVHRATSPAVQRMPDCIISCNKPFLCGPMRPHSHTNPTGPHAQGRQQTNLPTQQSPPPKCDGAAPGHTQTDRHSAAAALPRPVQFWLLAQRAACAGCRITTPPPPPPARFCCVLWCAALSHTHTHTHTRTTHTQTVLSCCPSRHTREDAQ